MEWVIYLSAAVILAVVLVALSWFKKDEQGNEEVEQRVRPRVGEGAQVLQGPNRAAANRGARARMRIAQARREEAEREEEEDVDVGDEVALPDGKVGKKKLQKLQAKAEKRAAREAEEREREERKERAEKIAEMRKKEEEKVAEEEAKREEEEQRLQEEKEKQEEEEYQRMKASFVVQEEGFDEEESEEKERDLLKEFVDCIKHEKVVVLEDIAARFKLKTTAVIDRITSLQQEGTLTGVVDDRGKFIYISTEELEAVAKFMKQRGRVSLAELADSSNTLISLMPESCSA